MQSYSSKAGPCLLCSMGLRPSTRPLLRIASSQVRQASTRLREKTLIRRNFEKWLNSPLGAALKYPVANSTNYLSGRDKKTGRLARVERDLKQTGAKAKYEDYDPKHVNIVPSARIPDEDYSELHPYPNNDSFVSQPVLSEKHRELIWQSVCVQNIPVKEVSNMMEVDTRRVAAVARLMALQRQHEAQGKPLAHAYNDAILSMVPTTQLEHQGLREEAGHSSSEAEAEAEAEADEDPLSTDSIEAAENAETTDEVGLHDERLPDESMIFFPGDAHEDINELPLHAHTAPQIFLPTSESRSFSRADAARTFNKQLQPADLRIPHPETVTRLRIENAGYPEAEQERLDEIRESDEAEKRQRSEFRRLRHEAATVVAPTKGGSARWAWRFNDVNIESSGRSGRKGVGWRYGAPLMDRKKGDVKIPTTAE